MGNETYFPICNHYTDLLGIEYAELLACHTPWREVWAAWSLRIPGIGDLDFLITGLPPLSVLSRLFVALESIHDIMNLFYDNRYYWLPTYANNCESMQIF